MVFFLRPLSTVTHGYAGQNTIKLEWTRVRQVKTNEITIAVRTLFVLPFDTNKTQTNVLLSKTRESVYTASGDWSFRIQPRVVRNKI